MSDLETPMSRKFPRPCLLKFFKTTNSLSKPLPPSQAIGRLLVLLNYLASDNVITDAAHSLLKDLLFSNPAPLLALLPLLDEPSPSQTDSPSNFIDALHAILDTHAEHVFDKLFKSKTLEVAKNASKQERAQRQLTREDVPSKIGEHMVQVSVETRG